MPYSADNLKRVTDAFAEKKKKAEDGAAQRHAAVCAKFPRIAEIDRELSSTGLKIFSEAIKGKSRLEERIKALKAETESLCAERAKILCDAGLDENYDSPKYDCPACSDTGYTSGGRMCGCMRAALAEAGFESSGMAKLISKQNFENFTLDYYTGADAENMKKTLARAEKFSDLICGGETRNMLFFGKTGLGKTHLSSAVAKRVIESGCDVVYESAQNVFADFEYEKFSRGYGDTSPSRTDKYFSCDLLIIDDLGTETSNQFSVSCLYNLLNDRIINEKSMLISTNADKGELLDRYSDRITSRLFGEFEVCLFTGKDVRSQKLKKQ